VRGWRVVDAPHRITAPGTDGPELVEAKLAPRDAEGRADGSGDGVALIGTQAGVREVLDLVERGLEDRDTRMAELSGEPVQIPYWVIYITTEGMFGGVHIEVPAPGIEHLGHLQALSNIVANAARQDVVILDWKQLKHIPKVVAAPTIIRPN
jgi:hypothetical protein